MNILYCLRQYRAMGANYWDLVKEVFRLVLRPKYRAEETKFFQACEKCISILSKPKIRYVETEKGE